MRYRMERMGKMGGAVFMFLAILMHMLTRFSFVTSDPATYWRYVSFVFIRITFSVVEGVLLWHKVGFRIGWDGMGWNGRRRAISRRRFAKERLVHTLRLPPYSGGWM